MPVVVGRRHEIRMLVYGSGRQSGRTLLAHSPDGINWYQLGMVSPLYLETGSGINYGSPGLTQWNGNFLSVTANRNLSGAGGSTWNIASSPDCLTWTKVGVINDGSPASSNDQYALSPYVAPLNQLVAQSSTGTYTSGGDTDQQLCDRPAPTRRWRPGLRPPSSRR